MECLFLTATASIVLRACVYGNSAQVPGDLWRDIQASSVVEPAMASDHRCYGSRFLSVSLVLHGPEYRRRHGQQPRQPVHLLYHNYTQHIIHRSIARAAGNVASKAGIPWDRHRHRHGHPRRLLREDLREEVGVPRRAATPDTHDDPRRLVRRLVRHARFSSRGCPLAMRACTRSTHCITFIDHVIYKCDKQATVIGRLLTILGDDDVPCRTVSTSTVYGTAVFQREVSQYESNLLIVAYTS